MKVWKAFARSRRLRITCFALAGALLVASIFGLGYSPAAPTEEVPTAKYEHKGNFDYTVYLKPSTLYEDVVLTDEEEEEEVPMVFLRDIMREVSLSFGYDFSCSRSLSSVTNKVVVSIIAENPDVWQKEMTQLEETYQGTEFSVDFPLDLSNLDSIVDDIENEIGIVGRERQFIIIAAVATTAETALGQTIEHTFSYELTAMLTAKKLELEGDLDTSKEAYWEGTRYEATGRFDYEVSLKTNKLYDTTVLRSEAPPVPEPSASPQTLGPGLVYFPNMIDNIEASFSYRFLCDRPISEQSQEVEITATIENPGKWSKSLVVMPETNREGSFTIPFSIDMQYFTKVIDAIGQETGVPGTSHNITIKADVHTVAQTDVGTINEVYTQTLSGKLESNTLTFDKELSGSQLGTLGGAAIPGASEEGRSRTPWIIGLVVALLALGYFGWSQSQLRLAMVSAGEAEAARARKKYKQIM
ncbi:MAG: DUF5305 domain-containing protein, partial [Dehalococcoidia bacterium]|nr:DUF5305 domain-containing protein [Dehalococcoidia bacterium]